MKPIRHSGAALLLLAGALAACADAPTATLTTAENEPAAFNTAPSVTVTNFNDDPLISWGALSGATGYTVQYVESRTTIIKATSDSRNEEFVSTLATTRETSHLDTPRTYTGDSQCTAYGTFETRMTWFRYRVTAHYPTGDATTTVPAPVSPC